MPTHQCPHCGRTGFKAAFGLTNHINACKTKENKSPTTKTRVPTSSTPTPSGDRHASRATKIKEWRAQHDPTALDKLTITKQPDGYWITGAPEGYDDMGPYKTKEEATSERISIQRTCRNAHKPGWITIEH